MFKKIAVTVGGCALVGAGAVLFEKVYAPYIVDVKSTGKYNNAVLGQRLFLTKKNAKEFYTAMKAENCDVEMTRMTRIHFGAYFA